MSLMGKRQIIASSVGCAVELPAVTLRCLGAGVSIGSCGHLFRTVTACGCGMWDSLFHDIQKKKKKKLWSCSSSSDDGSSAWPRRMLFLSRFIKHRTGLAALPG